MKQGSKLKHTQVYMNEHLTRRNVHIAKHARQLRKDGDIKDTWTRDCTIYIRCEDNSVKKILDEDDFPKLGLRPISEQ